MIAKGELVILDSDNIEQRVLSNNCGRRFAFRPLNWLAIPSNAITTVLILMALSLATVTGRTGKVSADGITPS